MQADYLISARRLDLEIVKKGKEEKENLANCGLCRHGRLQSKIKRKRKVPIPCYRTKTIMKHESGGDTNCN